MSQVNLRERIRLLVQFLVFSTLLLGLPLLGVMLAGRPAAPYLRFPPTTQHLAHAPFSWPVFVLDSFLAAAFFGWLVCLCRPRRRISITPSPDARRPFPWWGWTALGAVILFWWLAWTRQPWFASLQAHTFTPLWLGYIVFVNALAWKRTGRSLLTHCTGYFLALFPASALFWWYFEYLNRFVENWRYVGIDDFGPLRYTLHATLAFSTVLPAVISTREWLASWPGLGEGGCRPRFTLKHPRAIAMLVLVLSAAGLLGLGLWPDVLYPLVWVAPLLLIVSLQVIAGQPTLLERAGPDPWRLVALSMLAALVCGFLWELWNYHSQAKWVYGVPYVQRFHLFEMPLLGYTGYLPFGIECAVVADLVARLRERRGQICASH